VFNFVNVGQGDCILVEFPDGKRLLVDCGSRGGFDKAATRDYLRSHLDPTSPKIDTLVITHGDADHGNKLRDVLAAPSPIQVDRVVYVGSRDHQTSQVEEWLSGASSTEQIGVTDQHFNTYPPLPLPGFENDGVTVLAANVINGTSEENTRSIVLEVVFGATKVLLAGDATKDTDARIVQDFAGHEQELDVDVWKAAHHGAWATATQTDAWAKVIKPEVIVFSAAEDNSFGHPSLTLANFYVNYTNAAPQHRLRFWDKKDVPAAEAAYQQLETKAMYLTGTNGNVVVRTDGHTITTSIERN
jgi:competence protein ComEC